MQKSESPPNLERFKDLKNPDFDKFLKHIVNVPKSDVPKFMDEKERKLPRGKLGADIKKR